MTGPIRTRLAWFWYINWRTYIAYINNEDLDLEDAKREWVKGMNPERCDNFIPGFE
jgi:hypothetical protein